MNRSILRASCTLLAFGLAGPALAQSLPPLTPAQRQQIQMDVGRPLFDNMGLGGAVNYQPTGGAFWSLFNEGMVIWQRVDDPNEAQSFGDRPARPRTPDPNVRNLTDQGGGGGAGGGGGGGGAGGGGEIRYRGMTQAEVQRDREQGGYSTYSNDEILRLGSYYDGYYYNNEFTPAERARFDRLRDAETGSYRTYSNDDLLAMGSYYDGYYYNNYFTPAERARFDRLRLNQQGRPDLDDAQFFEEYDRWASYYDGYYYNNQFTAAERARYDQLRQWRRSSPSLYRNLQTFLDSGGTLTVAELLDIYTDFDFANPASRSGLSFSSLGNSPSAVGMSFSSAGISFSSLGNSFSSAGTSFSSAGSSLSLIGQYLALASGRFNLPGSLPRIPTGEQRLPYALTRDPAGNLGRFSAEGQLAGFTAGLRRDEILRLLRITGLTGLDRLLAQPFNVVLTWGAGAFDVDLHMTGPTGQADGSRFWIYYAQTGALEDLPFAQLIRDCICASGSEVILTTRLNQGGVYRISAFNFGNQSTTSTQLSTNADLELLIVRGGVAVPVGNGTTIEGGRVIFRGSPTPNRPGNTWVGVEIDPRTGQIRFVDRSDNSVNGDGTAGNSAASAAAIPIAIAAPLPAAVADRPAVRPAARPDLPTRFERPEHAQ